MRRKTIIVLGITFMVTVMVTAFSYLYVSETLSQQITGACDGAERLTKQLQYLASNDMPDLSSTRVDTNNPEAVRRALAEYLPMDTNILNDLQSDIALWPYVYDASIVDANGKVLLHTTPQLVGKPAVARPDFNRVRAARFRRQLRIAYGPAAVYDVSSPLLLNGMPFGTIHIGVSTVFLRSEIEPRLLRAVYFSIASIFASLLLAAGVSNLALGPLKKISRNLDSVSSGTTEALSGERVGARRIRPGHAEDRQPGPTDAGQPGNFFRAERQRRPAHVEIAGRPDAVRAGLPRSAGERAGGAIPGQAARRTAGQDRKGSLFPRYAARRDGAGRF